MTQDAIAPTQAWLERAVIGLNLCPFAKAVQAKGRIRWVQCDATEPAALLHCLASELQHLAAVPAEQTDTTLIVHPQVLSDFLDFNDFLDVADAALDDLGLAGTLQIASFHPGYQFAGSRPDDIGNCTNRAPFPTLHLLRESSIDTAVASVPDAADIFERNIRTLQRLGWDGWRALLVEPTADVPPKDHSLQELSTSKRASPEVCEGPEPGKGLALAGKDGVQQFGAVRRNAATLDDRDGEA